MASDGVVLATGGCGYIGSHVVLELLRAGEKVLVLDDLSNAKPAALERVARLAGAQPKLIEGDIRDRALLAQIFAVHDVRSVIHFAGLKAVGESTAEPLRYYDVNVGGAVALFQEMAAAGCKTLVFSSSATVYGDPESAPISEAAPTGATNPYGRTKLMIEQILADLAASDPEWSVICLRYFNPVGADQSGEIGEDPTGVPNNLFPYIAQVATGRREALSVFGDDYPTPDGTGVRDYIHVSDLAEGHVAALGYASAQAAPDAQPDQGLGFLPINLGRGRGYSVLEAVSAWSRAVGRAIPYKIAPRRPGDVAETFADPRRAAELLDWRASRDLDGMCVDHWRWQSQNPEGYPDERSDTPVRDGDD